MSDHARSARPAPARPGAGRAAIVRGLPGVTMIAGPGDPRMTERQLQDAVLGLCRWLHLLAYHTHDSRHSAAGFLDLVIVGRKILFRELKSDTGHITREQTAWIDGLRDAGADVDVWRPCDWYKGLIRVQLEAITFKAPTHE